MLWFSIDHLVVWWIRGGWLGLLLERLTFFRNGHISVRVHSRLTRFDRISCSWRYCSHLFSWRSAVAWKPISLERGRIGRDRPGDGLFPCLSVRGRVSLCARWGEWVFSTFSTRLFTFKSQGGPLSTVSIFYTRTENLHCQKQNPHFHGCQIDFIFVRFPN